MNLDQAKKLASLNERQLEQALRTTGYEYDNKNNFIDEILSVDIRENDVHYNVRFVAERFQDENEDNIGSLFVCEKDGNIVADF